MVKKPIDWLPFIGKVALLEDGKTRWEVKKVSNERVYFQNVVTSDLLSFGVEEELPIKKFLSYDEANRLFCSTPAWRSHQIKSMSTLAEDPARRIESSRDDYGQREIYGQSAGISSSKRKIKSSISKSTPAWLKDAPYSSEEWQEWVDEYGLDPNAEPKTLHFRGKEFIAYPSYGDYLLDMSDSDFFTSDEGVEFGMMYSFDPQSEWEDGVSDPSKTVQNYYSADLVDSDFDTDSSVQTCIVTPAWGPNQTKPAVDSSWESWTTPEKVGGLRKQFGEPSISNRHEVMWSCEAPEGCEIAGFLEDDETISVRTYDGSGRMSEEYGSDEPVQ